LTNFYQNHRNYISSRDDYQVRHFIVDIVLLYCISF
jgi:hypothetical protein